MPRPDKRFVRYPRQGSPPEPEAEAAKPAPEEGQTFVKGRHMVIPRPSNPPQAQSGQTTPTATPRRSVPSELTTSKYDARPTSGPVPSLQGDEPEVEPAATEPAAAEPAASTTEPTPTEVVFDLRESEHGFEGTYWKRDVDEPAADRDAG